MNGLPNIKSAKKRVLVNEKKATVNTARKSELKTIIKKAKAAVANKEGAEESVKVAVKALDQAVSKNTLHKNTAARRKSKLAKALNAAKAAQ